MFSGLIKTFLFFAVCCSESVPNFRSKDWSSFLLKFKLSFGTGICYRSSKFVKYKFSSFIEQLEESSIIWRLSASGNASLLESNTNDFPVVIPFPSSSNEFSFSNIFFRSSKGISFQNFFDLSTSS